MADIFGLIDLGITVLKQIRPGGFMSLYTGLQFVFWVTVLWIVLPYFISRLGGGGGE